MLADGNRGSDSLLHVLLVDEDTAVLPITCARLLLQGHDVSTRRSAEGLLDFVARLKPDLILVELLMRDLSRDDLFRLLTRYPPTGVPAVALHTRVARGMLRDVVDVADTLGLIPKTHDDLEFYLAFGTVVDRLALGEDRRVAHTHREVTTSGTHRVSPTLGDDKQQATLARSRSRGGE